jgi:hypothetical protein
MSGINFYKLATEITSGKTARHCTGTKIIFMFNGAAEDRHCKELAKMKNQGRSDASVDKDELIKYVCDYISCYYELACTNTVKPFTLRESLFATIVHEHPSFMQEDNLALWIQKYHSGKLLT